MMLTCKRIGQVIKPAPRTHYDPVCLLVSAALLVLWQWPLNVGAGRWRHAHLEEGCVLVCRPGAFLEGLHVVAVVVLHLLRRPVAHLSRHCLATTISTSPSAAPLVLEQTSIIRRELPWGLHN